MNIIYGLAVFFGAVGVLLAVALSLNPNRDPLPQQLRLSLLAVFGFGLAGISASFAGWPAGLALGAAIVGAVGLAYLGVRYSTEGDVDGPEGNG